MSIVPQPRRKSTWASIASSAAMLVIVALIGVRAWQRAHTAAPAKPDAAAGSASAPSASSPGAPAGPLRVGTPLTLRAHTQYVSSLAYSPDGRLLASGGADKTVKLWDSATGAPVRTFAGQPDTYWVAFSPDGNQLASAGQWPYDPAQRVIIWDVASGRDVRRLDPRAQFIAGVAWSPDGRTLAAGISQRESDSAIVMWDAASVRELRTIDGYAEPAFSPDGKFLAGVDQQGLVALFGPARDPAAMQPVQKLLEKIDDLIAIVWSPASRPGKEILATVADSPMVVLWDAESGRRVRTITDSAYVTAAAFSPDGSTLATASADHTVKLWDLATGTRLRTLTGHSGVVNCVAFRPDGRQLASGGADGAVMLWPISPATGAGADAGR